MAYIIYNGEVQQEEDVKISFRNRSFRYADGFFETMRFDRGKIILNSLHFDRLYSTLEALRFNHERFPAPAALTNLIANLASKNSVTEGGRVRLTVFAGDGLLHDVNSRIANYIIETSALQSVIGFVKEGLTIGVFKDAVKPSDKFSHLKTSNFLPYVMGSVWAKEHNLDDAILLNAEGMVADATIANVFIVDNGVLKTPPLNAGCVNGVMRRYLLACLAKDGIPFKEENLSEQAVLNASEVFLTNSINGIRWVKQVGQSNYGSSISSHLYKKFIDPLFS